MTNSEARKIAETILEHLAVVIKLADNQPHKVFVELEKLLKEVEDSKKGLIDPDQPINVPWSLFDTSLLRVLEDYWLPPPPEDRISGYTNGENV